MTYSTSWKTDMLYTDKMFLCKQKNIILLVLFKQIEQKRIAYCFVGVEGWKECSMQLVVSISVSSLDFFFVCVCVRLFVCFSIKASETTSEQKFFTEGPVRTYVPSWSHAIWWPGDSKPAAIHLKMFQRFLSRLFSL